MTRCDRIGCIGHAFGRSHGRFPMQRPTGRCERSDLPGACPWCPHQACAIGCSLMLRSGRHCRCSTQSGLAAKCHSNFVRSATRSEGHLCLSEAMLFAAPKGLWRRQLLPPLHLRLVAATGPPERPMCLAARVSLTLSEAAENMRASSPTMPSDCRAIGRASLCKSAHRSGAGSATLPPAAVALRTSQIWPGG